MVWKLVQFPTVFCQSRKYQHFVIVLSHENVTVLTKIDKRFYYSQWSKLFVIVARQFRRKTKCWYKWNIIQLRKYVNKCFNINVLKDHHIWKIPAFYLLLPFYLIWFLIRTSTVWIQTGTVLSRSTLSFRRMWAGPLAGLLVDTLVPRQENFYDPSTFIYCMQVKKKLSDVSFEKKGTFF